MSRGVITVFGSNRPEPKSEPYGQAFEVGRLLAAKGFTVCTGGYGGTMRATSEGARRSLGDVIGITVEPWGPPNEFVTQPVSHPTLIERLVDLVERADAYVALPGGTGTLLEIALVLEWQHKGTLTSRPLWCLGPQWSGAIRAALDGQTPGAWLAGTTRLPDYRFFETPEQIAEAADKQFA